MKHKTFFWFILPTFLAMFFFITLPIISVSLQSFHTPHENLLITVENCDPFGCKKATTIDHDATKKLKENNPLGKYVGLDIYFDRGHLAIEQVKNLWSKTNNFFEFSKRFRASWNFLNVSYSISKGITTDTALSGPQCLAKSLLQ